MVHMSNVSDKSKVAQILLEMLYSKFEVDSKDCLGFRGDSKWTVPKLAPTPSPPVTLSLIELA